MADAIGRYLEQIFKESDAPGNQRRKPPGFFVEVLEVRIPGESHENVRQRQQNHRLPEDGDMHAEQVLVG